MVDEFDYSAILDRPNVTAAAIDRIVAALSSNMSQPVASSSTALIPNYTFDDLEYFCTTIIPSIKVDELKLVIDQLNRDNYRKIPKAGRKQELIDRLQAEYRGYAQRNDIAGYRKARHAFTSLMGGYGAPRTASGGGGGGSQSTRTTSSYTNGMNTSAGGGAMPRHSYGGASGQAGSSSGFRAPGAGAGGAGGANGGGEPNHRFSHSAAGTTSMTSTTGTPRLSVAGYNLMLQWKSTPMWRAVRAVSDVVWVPVVDDGNNHERKIKSFYFDIPPDVQAALKNQNRTPAMPGEILPKRSLRIFCTTNEFYNNPNARIPPEGIPMDLPNAPDLIVNSVVVPMKKGIKGKPNTAPPADLENGGVSTLRFTGVKQQVTFGQTGPSMNKKTKAPKRFFIQVCLTETFTSADVRAKILAGKKRSRQEVLGGLKKSAEEDDIQVGAAKMSLRCPLSYVRIRTPIRSTKCTHLQCCDLDSWLQINDQTPQFLCPTCDQEMNLDTIFIDEYFSAISQACPDSVDEVLVEADGEWHTEDNKYHSDGWKQPGPSSKTATPAAATPARRASPPTGSTSSAPDVKPQALDSNQDNVIDIDDSSDEDTDDDEPDIPLASTHPYARRSSPRPAAPPPPPARPAAPASRAVSASADDVVDLTADSDDEVITVPSSSVVPSPALESTVNSSNKRDRRESDANGSDDDHVPFRPAQRPRVDSNGSNPGTNGGATRGFSSFAQNGNDPSFNRPNGSASGSGGAAPAASSSSSTATNGRYVGHLSGAPPVPLRTNAANDGGSWTNGGGTNSLPLQPPSFRQSPSSTLYSPYNSQLSPAASVSNPNLHPLGAQPRVPSPLSMNGDSPLTPLSRPSSDSPQANTNVNTERNPFDALLNVAQQHQPSAPANATVPRRSRFDSPPPPISLPPAGSGLDILDAIAQVEAARASGLGA